MGERDPSPSGPKFQYLLWQRSVEETFLPSVLKYLGWPLLEKDHFESSFLRVQTSSLTFTQLKANPPTVCGQRLEKVLACPKVNSCSSSETYWQQITDTTPCSMREIDPDFKQLPASWILQRILLVLPPKSQNTNSLPLPDVRKSPFPFRRQQLESNRTRLKKISANVKGAIPAAPSVLLCPVFYHEIKNSVDKLSVKFIWCLYTFLNVILVGLFLHGSVSVLCIKWQFKSQAISLFLPSDK